ncbi:MAG: Fe-S cluster assembly protein SufD [Zoogloeaceae bacterium]|nr:Fe-S cluster assembly protein SufD [Zoogloeaceae bacterium]
MSAVASWAADFKARAPALPGANLPWLAALRKRAIDRFGAEGWPTRRKENWHHTSLAFMEEQVFSATGTHADPAAIVARLRAGETTPGHWLVFVAGHHAPALSAIGALPAGARLISLADALAQADDATASAIEQTFGSSDDGDSPAALNAAFATDGAFIHLARGLALEETIHLVFIAGADEASRHLRNLVVAEAGSRATIVEHYPDSGDAATLTNVVTRIDAGADTNISHLKLQQEGELATHIARLDTQQARGAALASHSLSFGARLARHDICTRFDGEGGEVLLNGLYHVDGRRHVDHQTRIEHASPRCNSREFYRGLVDDNARGVFAGRIIVAQDAQRSDAMQRCDNLLLSRQAEADARPELEIYADDVKCAHGATVGQIDDDSLFYLRSRGLDELHARHLLTYAFAAEALARIELPTLRQRAREALLARLPGADALGEMLEELA